MLIRCDLCAHLRPPSPSYLTFGLVYVAAAHDCLDSEKRWQLLGNSFSVQVVTHLFQGLQRETARILAEPPWSEHGMTSMTGTCYVHS